MICTTIHDGNLEQIYEALVKCEMAEIRLDSCSLNDAEIEECFTSDIPLVATCRISEVMSREPSLQDPGLTEQSRGIRAVQIAEKRLIKAIEAGARYVDVELEAPKQMSKRIRNVAHENGTVFIRSYHDFAGTDSAESLKALVEKCRYHGADMVKIVTMAHSQEDVDRVMALYDWCRSERGSNIGELADGGLVAFCMGEAGRQSRLDCLRAGAPFTYAALTPEDVSAPGQWPVDEMMKAVYGVSDSRGFKEVRSSRPLQMPSSKSFAQRAIVAAALAEGTSHLRGYTPCRDTESALRVAKEIGAEVTVDGKELTITGIGASAGCLAHLAERNPGHEVSLHMGESGLLARMMMPLMSQLCPYPVTLTGEKTLLQRPLSGAEEIMDAFGVRIGRSCGTSCDAVRLPLTVNGQLKAGRAEISGRHGSQLISGLLMALPFADRNSSLIVHEPKSIPYMFITLEVLKKFGVKVGNDMLGGRDFIESDGDWNFCTEMVFKIKGGQKYKAADVDLEGDWSAAANFLVAGAVFGKLEIQGLDTTSLQADLSVMDILMDAGASLSQMDGDKGCITVQRAPLRAFSVDASNCPDLFPIISVLAAFCQGTSRIAGVGRLAGKETDRAKAIVGMLTGMGVNVSVVEDEMIIEGHTLVRRLLNNASGGSGAGLLKGGSYTSYGDHRMAMALKVASLGADSPVIIDDEECTDKSFPQFNELFGEISIY